MPKAIQKAVDLIVKDTWPKRRLLIYVTLAFCALHIAAAMGAAIAANDMTAVLNLAGSAFLLGGTTLTTYIFGANSDDKDKRKHLPTATPPTTKQGE
ncbi:hypothetical protein [Devosia submarina]|uniref:hypothetical protein n=1 Tax=Devosia submarina TaxID=1173082 RepID=UPI000D3AB78D|nr:hypothetical protein [Devosia submarina]